MLLLHTPACACCLHTGSDACQHRACRHRLLLLLLLLGGSGGGGCQPSSPLCGQLSQNQLHRRRVGSSSRRSLSAAANPASMPARRIPSPMVSRLLLLLVLLQHQRQHSVKAHTI